MRERCRIIFWMLLAYFLLFCILFGTPILSGIAAKEVLTWVGCKLPGFDTPYVCPDGNIIGNRFGPLSHWVLSLVAAPVVFLVQFWDVLLGWGVLIVVFALLAEEGNGRKTKKARDADFATETRPNVIDVILVFSIPPLLLLAWFGSASIGPLVLDDGTVAQPAWSENSALFGLSVLAIAVVFLVARWSVPLKNNREVQREEELEYAGFMARARALFVDALLISLVVFPPLISIYGWSYFDDYSARFIIDQMDFFVFLVLPAIALAVYPPMVLVYWGWNSLGAPDLFLTRIFPIFAVIGCWVLMKGATPGKKMFSLQIVNAATGGPAGTAQLIGRYFAYILSIVPFGLGFFWMIFDKHKQGWHDKLAGTAVVKRIDA